MTDDSNTPLNDPLDDWDLDDNELSLGENIKTVPIGFAKNKTFPAEPDASPNAPTPSIPATPTVTDPEPIPPNAPDPKPTLSSKSTSRPPVHKIKPPSTTTPIEKAALFLVTLSLLGLAYWGISTFYREAPEGTLVEFTTDFPVAGQKVNIESVDTWWREPILTGDNPDTGVVIDTQLIPCASITLAGGGNTTLQASFRDGDGKLIGDTRNLIVKNGRFAKNNSPEITVHGTAGFFNASDINPYVNGDIDPWSLIIAEADQPGKELVKFRVSTKRLDP